MKLTFPATAMLLLVGLRPASAALACQIPIGLEPPPPEIFPSGVGAPRNTRVVVLDDAGEEVVLVDDKGRTVPTRATVLQMGHWQRPTALVLTPERLLRAHRTYCVRSASSDQESCFTTTDAIDRDAPTPGALAEVPPSRITFSADVGAAADDSPFLLEVEVRHDASALSCAVLLAPPPDRLEWMAVGRGGCNEFEPDLCLSRFARGQEATLRVRWVDAAGHATAWQSQKFTNGLTPAPPVGGVWNHLREPGRRVRPHP